MTLIANEPATQDEAMQFPRTDVVTAPSALEKALVLYFKSRRPGFWDMGLGTEPISPGRLARWASHAGAVRARAAPLPSTWLPPGRKTDRALRPGHWMALPLRGGGFGAAMLVDKPGAEVRLFSDAVVMGMRRRWSRWPVLEDVLSLRPEDGALVAQTSMICVRDGRWRVLGEHPAFDPEVWVWPRPWWQLPEHRQRGVIGLPDETGLTEVRISDATLALDPRAGERCRGMWSYSGLETEIHRMLTAADVDFTADAESAHGVVTPERLAAWRAINGEIRRALARITTAKT